VSHGCSSQTRFELGQAALAAPYRRRKAWIIEKNGGWSLIDCTVCDLSEGGAKLQIDPALGIPSHFDLLFGNELEIIPVRIRWRRRNFMGVEFAGPRRSAPPFRLC
jgi:PilZ domain-containing protein